MSSAVSFLDARVSKPGCAILLASGQEAQGPFQHVASGAAAQSFVESTHTQALVYIMLDCVSASCYHLYTASCTSSNIAVSQ
jgi:hypothetical protein